MLKGTVKLFLEKYKLLKPKNNIIVAFSGGYDSMCLLHIMQELSKEYNLNLIAIHLNHNWRGKESDNEENNCKKFCNYITFYSEKLSDKVAHTETAAREARYKFFEKCAKKFKSKVILTAHNANDNAETVLYRIIKGTGLTGLEGIQENRDIYYRPLLRIQRNEIEEYCKKHKLTPNQDSSNNNVKYARNKIRLEILPRLESVVPDVIQNINNLSENAKIANSIINSALKNIEEYTTKEYCKLSDYHQSSVIHNFFRKLNLDYDKKRINTIVEFINKNKNSKSGKTISITSNMWLFVNNKKIEIIDKQSNLENTSLKIKKDGIYEIGEYKFEIKKCTKKPTRYPKDEDMTAYIEYNDELDFDLRTRNNGDIIQPLGLSGKQKLKKYFNEKKIPNHQKDKIILLCKGNEVYWASSIGISDKIKVKTKPTHKISIRRK